MVGLYIYTPTPYVAPNDLFDRRSGLHWAEFGDLKERAFFFWWGSSKSGRDRCSGPNRSSWQEQERALSVWVGREREREREREKIPT
jgi:hypothetical protein